MTFHLFNEVRSARCHCTLSDELISSLRSRGPLGVSATARFAIAWSWRHGTLFDNDWTSIESLRDTYQTRVICCTPGMLHKLNAEVGIWTKRCNGTVALLTRSEIIEAHCWRYLTANPVCQIA